jgi:hypothetical protein
LLSCEPSVSIPRCRTASIPNVCVACARKVRDDEGVRIVRNFSSYGRRSAAAFGGDENITQQIKKFERAALREIEDLKKI